MRQERTYYPPMLHAVTGLAYHTTGYQPIFENENTSFGVSAIDAPQTLPMGGVSVLHETDDFVMAKDFVSARAS